MTSNIGIFKDIKYIKHKAQEYLIYQSLRTKVSKIITSNAPKGQIKLMFNHKLSSTNSQHNNPK